MQKGCTRGESRTGALQKGLRNHITQHCRPRLRDPSNSRHEPIGCKQGTCMWQMCLACIPKQLAALPFALTNLTTPSIGPTEGTSPRMARLAVEVQVWEQDQRLHTVRRPQMTHVPLAALCSPMHQLLGRLCRVG